MNITILCYLEDESKAEYDVVVEQVADALREKGHKPSVLGIHGDVKKLDEGLARLKPDLVFNLMEMFGENLFGEISVVGLLDCLNIPYTGGGPGEFYLQQDKGLAKKLLSFDNILYPDFAVFAVDSSLETGGKLRMPLFVKPLRADASIGIDSRSLVHNGTELMERVLFIHKEVKDSALVEEYIEGREFYIGVVGNIEPVAFPPVEMSFANMKEGVPHILDNKAKWEADSDEYRGTEAIMADIPDEMRAKLQRVALDAYRALRVRDYGRIDIRMTEAGEIYVIEVNASCYLEQNSEFATSAKAHGIEYADLVNKIVEYAEERYRVHGTRIGRRPRRTVATSNSKSATAEKTRGAKSETAAKAEKTSKHSGEKAEKEPKATT